MFKVALFFISLLLTITNAFCADSNHYLLTPVGGDFQIKTAFGEKVKLSDFKGKTVFLFFGFTKCPSACPFTIQRLKKLRDHVLEKKRDDLQILFISVDNERDNVEVLKQYQKSFGSLMLTATDKDEELRRIMSLYGGRFSRIKRSDGSLLVDHTDNVYVINPKGEWSSTLRYNGDYQNYLEAYNKSRDNYEIIKKLISSRKIALLAKNQRCDLGKTSCAVRVDSDNSTLKISLSPYPVKSEKKIEISVETSSKKYLPIEVDFVGLEQNMGLIRPKLTKDTSSIYKGSFELPICEIEKMKWQVRVLLRDPEEQVSFVEFFLKEE